MKKYWENADELLDETFPEKQLIPVEDPPVEDEYDPRPAGPTEDDLIEHDRRERTRRRRGRA